MQKQIDICSTCRFGVRNYTSVIGNIPWCCEKHWHCKPGSLASDYVPKPEPKFDGVEYRREVRCRRMSVIEELADICLRQAGIIKAQAEVLEQLGAQALEDEALSARLQTLVGDVNMTEYRRSV